MNCPKCMIPLQVINYEGVVLDTCTGCHGEWLDKEELLRINKAREVVFSNVERSQTEGVNKGVPTKVPGAQKVALCPRCAKPMQMFHYAYDSGVFVDRCNACEGLWLDSGELEARQMIVEGWEAKHAQLHAEFDGVLAHIRQKTSARLETMMSKKGFKSFLTKAIVYDLI